MHSTIDVRGLSCPQPVLLTLDNIKKQKNGEMEILVDTETAKENVSRAVSNEGWQIKAVKDDSEGYRIRIAKD